MKIIKLICFVILITACQKKAQVQDLRYESKVEVELEALACKFLEVNQSYSNINFECDEKKYLEKLISINYIKDRSLLEYFDTDNIEVNLSEEGYLLEIDEVLLYKHMNNFISAKTSQMAEEYSKLKNSNSNSKINSYQFTNLLSKCNSLILYNHRILQKAIHAHMLLK